MSESDIYKYTGPNEDEITITRLSDGTFHFMLCKYGDVSGVAVPPAVYDAIVWAMAKDLLLRTVDLTWGYAYEDGSVPATSTALKIIGMAQRGDSYTPDRGTSREQVYRAIDGERDYQDRLPPSRTDSRSLTVGDSITMLQHYQNEAVAAWTNNAGDEPSLHVIRKIAGICVRCMEEHGAPPRVRVPFEAKLAPYEPTPVFT